MAFLSLTDELIIEYVLFIVEIVFYMCDVISIFFVDATDVGVYCWSVVGGFMTNVVLCELKEIDLLWKSDVQTI